MFLPMSVKHLLAATGDETSRYALECVRVQRVGDTFVAAATNGKVAVFHGWKITDAFRTECATFDLEPLLDAPAHLIPAAALRTVFKFKPGQYQRHQGVFATETELVSFWPTETRVLYTVRPHSRHTEAWPGVCEALKAKRQRPVTCGFQHAKQLSELMKIVSAASGSSAVLIEQYADGAAVFSYDRMSYGFLCSMELGADPLPSPHPIPEFEAVTGWEVK